MIIQNKKAHFDYDIQEEMEAGIVLTGAETKSFHENRVTLQGSFVKPVKGEFYLLNSKFTWNGVPSEKQNRSRKLLVHKREILAWENKIKEKKLTIVPISMYNIGRFIKVKIGLGKSKKEFSKKEKIKKRDISREAERDYKVKV